MAIECMGSKIQYRKKFSIDANYKKVSGLTKSLGFFGSSCSCKERGKRREDIQREPLKRSTCCFYRSNQQRDEFPFENPFSSEQFSRIEHPDFQPLSIVFTFLGKCSDKSTSVDSRDGQQVSLFTMIASYCLLRFPSLNKII